MTNGILNSIKYRDKIFLKLKALSNGTDLHNRLSENIKSHNKILKKLIRQAKIQYYADQFNKNKSNTRHTWSTIKDILNKCKDKKDFPAFFTLNGKNMDDKTEISNIFNNFFAGVGKKNFHIASNIMVLKQFRPFWNKGLYLLLILNVSASLMWRKSLKILHQRTALAMMVSRLVF